MASILLDAVYINQSGGKVLLEYFIKKILAIGIEQNVFFLLDNRLETDMLVLLPAKNVLTIDSKESKRKNFYKGKNFETIFCFANVPPPVVQRNTDVIILFHNSLILDNSNSNYRFAGKINFWLKKNYIKFKNQKHYRWVVQTNSMRNLLSHKIGVEVEQIKILPFYEGKKYFGVNEQNEENNTKFLYVADGVPQKNHKLLLLAWETLHDEFQLKPDLHLTIPKEYHKLTAEIDRLRGRGLNIVNHGKCNSSQLKELYANCNTYLSPSFAESFGLPIIEATEAGCNVLSADLSYIYDIVVPSQTFNPVDIKNFAKKIDEICTKGYVGLQKTTLIAKDNINEIIDLIN